MGISLVIWPGSEGLEKAAKAVSHPAGLSKVSGNGGGPIPYESHEERIKLARAFAERHGASAPESAKAHQPSRVNVEGLEAGGKAPYSGFAVSTSGSGSRASNLFNAPAGENVTTGATGNTRAPKAGKVARPKK